MKKIKNEWDLIKRIQKKIETGLPKPEGVVFGIGDDCAVFELDELYYGLITTDASVEHIHFLIDLSAPEKIGYKAMISNVSDIASMAGVPELAFVTLGVPDYLGQDFVLSLYDGLIRASRESRMFIAGGDTTRSAELIISIALYGRVRKDRMVTRNGARAGDSIFVTGTLGDSMAGLELLKSGSGKDLHTGLVKKHEAPSGRLGISGKLYDGFRPTAMIDISDGLLSDLRHLCDSSGAGFILNRESLPVSAELEMYLKKSKSDLFRYASMSGEEYELLLTSAGHSSIRSIGGVRVTRIGEITDSGFYISENGSKKEIKIAGYDHFEN